MSSAKKALAVYFCEIGFRADPLQRNEEPEQVCCITLR
jgi:hypothetical protein